MFEETKRILFGAALLACLAGCSEGSGPTNDPSNTADQGVLGDQGIVGTPGATRFAMAEEPATTPLGLIPFPNDLYRDASGRLDLRGFPGQVSGSILGRLVESLQAQTSGFGTSAAHYLGFVDPVFEAALPENSAESMLETSSLFLVDVDASSPEYGRRFPVNWRINKTETMYLPAHTLAMRLVEGLSLRPATTYAFGATKNVATATEAFDQLMAAERMDGVSELAWGVYEPLRSWSADVGVEVAIGAVFTTQDPVSELFRMRNFIANRPAPEVYEVEYKGKTADVFELYTGKYMAPRFQQGELPYLAEGTGGIGFDENGEPVITDQEELRFALSIPLEQEMPPGGWPVVLYGHGTGGDFRSFIGAKVALTLARAGIAVLSIDQIHHAYRDKRPDGCHTTSDPAACVSLVFFNFLVPAAGRDNVRQSALDFVSLLKVAQSFDMDLERRRRRTQMDSDPGDEAPPEEPAPAQDSGISDAGLPLDAGAVADAGVSPDLGEVDAAVSPSDAGIADMDIVIGDEGVADGGDLDMGEADRDGQLPADAGMDEGVMEMRARVKLDPQRVVYMGHSQGGLNGPLFLAVEPNVLGGVLSAAGAQLSVTLEQKTEPVDINDFVQQVVSFGAGDTADRWHPVFGLLQTFIEPGDPVNYAGFWFKGVPEGYPHKHILMTAGLNDEYTPPDSIFALAAAGGVPIVEPVLREIELFEIMGIAPAGIPPYGGNVGGGEASAGLIQLDDFGHFAIQRSNTLRNRYRRFIESVMNGNASIY